MIKARFAILILVFSVPFFFLGCAFAKKQAPSGNEETLKPEKVFVVQKNEPPLSEVAEQVETTVPILMFHYVRTVDENKDVLGYNLSIDPEIFDKELAWLKENGYKTIPTESLKNGSVPEKSIVLSFDDGYEDFFINALPLLEKYGFTASIALITERIGQPGYLSDDQIRNLTQKKFELMSHTESHPDLTAISLEKARKEILGSKEFLENSFGVGVSALVYPSGRHNKEIEKIVEEAGYKFAFTTNPGKADLRNNILELKRIRIDNRDGFIGFINKLQN